MLGLVIFRRDLRLQDNIALYEASIRAEKIIPLFVLTDEQTGNNPYKSDKALTFMYQCMRELDSSLKELGHKLIVRRGNPAIIVEEFINGGVELVVLNKDYTPYAIRRDEEIGAVCDKHGVELVSCDDDLLLPIGTLQTQKGTAYKRFSHFYKGYSKYSIDKPLTTEVTNFYSDFNSETIPDDIEEIDIKGGRSNYDLSNLTTQGKMVSSRVSAYIKFGCYSVREILDHDPSLLRKLVWRDFWYNIAYHYPSVFSSTDDVDWDENEEKFKLWKTGTTGVPIVDAGMRELNSRGFIHNRMRMIVADFLVKQYNVDWRKGERYFATQLIDYDPSVNNGNWQWIAGTGTESQPKFRKFNMDTQTKKFDPNHEYIRMWL